MAEEGTLRRKNSAASVSSKTSHVTIAGRGFAAAGAALRKGANGLSSMVPFRAPSRSGTAAPAAAALLEPGDQCETVSLVTVRTEEHLESDFVAELPLGSFLEVLQVGEGRRIKIRSGTIEGWISARTKMNEPLVQKRKADISALVEDFEVGGQHEVKSLVTVRAEEGLDSEVVKELQPGTIVRILELGVANRRRAKIATESVEGWISVATRQGELLLGKVSDPARATGITNGVTGSLFGASSSKIKALLEAARSGDLPALRKTVEGTGGMLSKFTSRPSLNSSDVRGKTALIYAAAFGNKEVVEYLLTKTREVEVNALDDTQKSALHHASKRVRTRRGPEFDGLQADIITMLLHAGAYLEARDHNGCTALMFAVANGDEAVTRRLLTAQANVNVKDFEGHAPLDYAKTFGHHTLVRLLKGVGAQGAESDEETACPPSPGDAASPMSPAPSWTSQMPPGGGDDFGIGSVPSPVLATFGAADGAAGEAEAPKKKTVKKKKAEAGGAADAAADGVVAEGGETALAVPKKKKAEKGEKVPKRKSRKASIQDCSAMLEAVAGAEDAQEVTVEADQGEQVDEAARALTKLRAVVDGSASPKELEEAIKAAQAAGVPPQDLAEADQCLKALKARARAREGLKQAERDRDVARLTEAIATAEACKVPEAEIAEARRILAEEAPRERARAGLRAAQDSGDARRLKAAIDEGVAAGLGAAELAEFRELLSGAESKEKAEEHLRQAVQERNVHSLKFAIQQAKEAGVDRARVREAEAVLAEEEPKQRARELLAEACESISVPALRAALNAAQEARLAPAEYAEAAQLLRQEEEKARLLGLVRAALEASKQAVPTDIDSLREAKDHLSATIQEAIRAGVAEADLAEAEQRRKKLHNAIEDLKGSIRVFCRIRPLSSKEVGQGDTSITRAVDNMTLQVGEELFQFDAVFTPGTQDEIFEDCRDLVQSAVDGYNVTMFAYGQTGAGKTFTMYGAPGMEGTAPRTIREIFRVIEEGQQRFQYTVMGSMLELYRNDLVDLLSKGNPGASKSKLNVRQEKSGMVIVEHLTEEECRSAEELSDLLERGNSMRTVAATAMNSESSRSHLVLLIKIVSVNRETKEQLRGKILICDLAGSERLKKSQVTAEMQKEAIEINKSLTALGDVIEALTKSAKLIPYRNHKLTQLMQDSLGGTAKTLMFVNCSPASSNLDETTMSLKYATRAKKITNTAKKGT